MTLVPATVVASHLDYSSDLITGLLASTITHHSSSPHSNIHIDEKINPICHFPTSVCGYKPLPDMALPFLSDLLPIILSAPATWVSFLFLRHSKLIPFSGPQINTQLAPSPSRLGANITSENLPLILYLKEPLPTHTSDLFPILCFVFIMPLTTEAIS